jgi:serine/threonine-protein kinase HipA
MALDVQLYGERIGTLFPAGDDDYRFAYAPEVVEKAGAGTPLLSNSLPARPEPFSAETTRAYFDGLLPQGMRREKIAREHSLEVSDGYGLLAEIGRDCAGAVVIVPEGTPTGSGADEVVWLGEEEFAELVRQPPPSLFDSGCEPRMRFALAGIHHKLALVRDESGERWGWPTPSVPSTHIVKPETGAYPEMVANEMFCTMVAADAGLPVVETALETLGGQRCLVSRRFDREGDGPHATRLHQEDLCQALGFPPDPDEDDDDAVGPRFAEASGLLKAVDRVVDLPLLLTAAICNYVLGNSDAHGKNFALQFGEEGPFLAPFYDITSTAVYDEPTHIGLVLSEEYDETAYLLELAYVCEECDFNFEVFRKLASETAEKVRLSLENVSARARAEGWHTPVIEGIVDLARDRSYGLGYEVEY